MDMGIENRHCSAMSRSGMRSASVNRLLTIASHIVQPTTRRSYRPSMLSITQCSAHSDTTSATVSPLSQRLQGMGFERILNIGDLGEATSKIKPGRIYRAGSPAHASIMDVKLLRGELAIEQLIDLRSAEERREDSAWSLMMSNGCIKTYDADGNLTEIAVDHNAQLAGIDLPDCELHRLSLLEKDRFIRGLMWKLPVTKLAFALGWRVLGQHEKMRDLLVPEINRGGLQLVYEILMESAGADICRTLEIVTDAASARKPQMFFCKLGKDRTGLLAALVLSCCGVSPQEIIADYARSDGVDQIALGGLEKMKDVQGMDPKIFSSAPPEAMAALLEYAERKFGGMGSYMESIGFVKEQQMRLCASLTSDEEW